MNSLKVKLNKSYNKGLRMLMLVVCAICMSCTDEFGVQVVQGEGFTIVGEPVQAYLSIAVDGMSVDVGTRAEEPASDYDGEDTEDERHVDDLWIFEYDRSSGKLIYTPQRVEISDQSELADVRVTLSNNYGKAVILYVVANAGSGVEEDSEEWVVFNNSTETYDGFMTLSELEKNTLPTPHPQRMTWDDATQEYVLDSQDASNVSIPMGGSVETTVKDDTAILVPVERMFAKVMVRVDLSEFSEEYQAAWLNTVTIGNIPEYSTVGTLWDGDRGNTAAKADYKNCERWLQRRFNSIGETNTSTGLGSNSENIYPYIIYVPENIQGENGSEEDKAANIPSSIRGSYDTDALSVIAGIYVVTSGGATQGEYTSFVAYPGGNSTTNFNVRRNCVYQVTLKITDLIDDMLPSANCIVCLSGVETTFWPYYREETGGGYDFTDYLDAKGDDESKKISYVKIIWQSTDGGNMVDYSDSATGYIGDNSENEYVWIDDVEKGEAIDEYHRRIHVSIPESHTGNALIGAYNDQDEIIWSWHIWSRLKENDPTTVNTKLYYTYEWDENGIYGKDSGHPRVAGYTIMNCNLGAMQDDPSGSPSSISNVLPTYGTTYQWGRKDPFPPVRVYPGSTANNSASMTYSSSQTGNYFDNENKVVTIVNTNTPEALFHSVEGTERKVFSEMIPLTIQNPTVFYAGTNEVNKISYSYIAFASANVDNFYVNYPEPYDGNWLLDDSSEHYNRLWGGYDPEQDADKITKTYNTGLEDALGDVIHMYDDYGEKSIFDPCPYGWRVSPPDLWLGFTSTGLNPTTSYDNVNYHSSSTYSGQYGLTMYLTAWREGETSFFPTQGVRAPDGCSFKVGTCGNYNNATADVGDRVNTLHVHYNSITDFNIFENRLIPYHIKCTAGPLRCVRINSVQE